MPYKKIIWPSSVLLPLKNVLNSHHFKESAPKVSNHQTINRFKVLWVWCIFLGSVEGSIVCKIWLGKPLQLNVFWPYLARLQKTRPLLRKVKHNNVQPQNERSDTPKLHPESFRAGSAYSHCVIDRKLHSLTLSQGGPDLRSFQHDLLQTSLVLKNTRANRKPYRHTFLATLSIGYKMMIHATITSKCVGRPQFSSPTLSCLVQLVRSQVNDSAFQKNGIW